MIKQGYDHFEVTRQEPKVEFCENKYVFDPAAPAGSTKPLVFNASAKCPVYQIPSEIADAVSAKQAQDDAKIAELVAKGTPVAQRRPDIDGGMNRVFASKLPDGATGLSDPEPPGVQTAAYSRAPGTIPPHVNPPKATAAATTSYSASLFAASEEPVVAAPSTRVASASSDGGFFSNLAKKVGIGGSETTATATTAPAAPVPTPAAKPKAVASKAGPSAAPATPASCSCSEAGRRTRTARGRRAPAAQADAVGRTIHASLRRRHRHSRAVRRSPGRVREFVHGPLLGDALGASLFLQTYRSRVIGAVVADAFDNTHLTHAVELLQLRRIARDIL